MGKGNLINPILYIQSIFFHLQQILSWKLWRNIGISGYRNIGIWEYWNMGILEYGNIGIWEYRNMGISEYGNIGISEYRKSSFSVFFTKKMKQSDYYPTKTYKPMILKHLLTFNFQYFWQFLYEPPPPRFRLSWICVTWHLSK